MMKSLGIGFEVTLDKKSVVSKLALNRERHHKLVMEARGGYLIKAKEATKRKLAQLEEGHCIKLNDYNLQPPEDYRNVYDTALSMLSGHQGETVRLNADEYRHLMDDEWEWTSQFIRRNSDYSAGTREWAASRRSSAEEDWT